MKNLRTIYACNIADTIMKVVRPDPAAKQLLCLMGSSEVGKLQKIKNVFSIFAHHLSE